MPVSTPDQKSRRSARRSPSANTTTAKPNAKESTVNKTTARRTAAKPAATTTTTKPAARKTRTTSTDAKTLTVNFTRNSEEPRGQGGVRFNEVVAKGKEPIMRTAYVDQATDKKMGSPKEIALTLTVVK